MTSEAARDQTRTDELRSRLAQVNARIASACEAAGRSASEITLIAVTKTFPASDVARLAALGITEVGENRDQEAAPKAAECAALGLTLHWHFVGQLQVNKVASVVRYAEVIHSVDRLRLATALGARARAIGRVITCLVQVSLDAEPGRGGARPSEVEGLASAIAGQDGLVLGGVMAIAPLGQPPLPAFRRLRQVADQVRAEYPAASIISAGMSQDLDEAISEGATHVRVGTALLGGRQAFVR